MLYMDGLGAVIDPHSTTMCDEYGEEIVVSGMLSCMGTG